MNRHATIEPLAEMEEWERVIRAKAKTDRRITRTFIVIVILLHAWILLRMPQAPLLYAVGIAAFTCLFLLWSFITFWLKPHWMYL